MIYQIPMTEGLDLKLGLKDEHEQMIQDLYVLLNTTVNECPMYRDFGLDRDFMHMPVNAAQPVMTSAIVDALDRFMPDLSVDSVEYDIDGENAEILSAGIEVSEGE